MKYRVDHGVHIGVFNNPARKKDLELNEFLKRKTLATVVRFGPIGSRDYTNTNKLTPQKEYVYHVFEDLNDVLRFLVKSNDNIQWLVLFAAGTLLTEKDPYRLWIETLPDAQASFVGAYAHLQIPPDHRSFKIHPQALAINAHAVRENAKAIFETIGRSGAMEVRGYRSQPSYHDGYTPYWFMPSKDKHMMEVSAEASWLIPLINSGYAVMNFSQETMRQTKQFFYMETPEQLKLGLAYKRGEAPETLLAMAEAIDKRVVMNNFLIVDQKRNNWVLLSNTNRRYSEMTETTNCDAIALPAAGTNFSAIHACTGQTIRKYYHYDISDEAIRFREAVIKDWDGTNFDRFFETIRRPTASYVGGLEGFGEIENWRDIQALDYKFFNIDILRDWKSLLTKMKDDGCVSPIFDLSNILSYHRTIYEMGTAFPTQVFKQMVAFLDENFENWSIRTDFFNFSKEDLKRFDSGSIWTSRNPAFGYLLYRTNYDLPLTPFLTAWENSAVDLEDIFGKLPKSHDFRRKIWEKFNKITKPVEWEEFYQNDYLPFVELDLNFDHEAMLAEARAAYGRGLFNTHRTDDENGWSSLVIFGLGHGKTKSYESYFPGEPMDYTKLHFTDEARRCCPTIVEYFERIFPDQTGVAQFTRVRIMALEPGGFILPHYDSFTSTCPGPINMALNHPVNCDFHMWKGSNYTRENYFGRLPFRPGAALNIDVGNSHMVYNLSNEVRFHMIAHVVINETNRKAYREFRTRSLEKMRVTWAIE